MADIFIYRRNKMIENIMDDLTEAIKQTSITCDNLIEIIYELLGTETTKQKEDLEIFDEKHIQLF